MDAPVTNLDDHAPRRRDRRLAGPPADAQTKHNQMERILAAPRLAPEVVVHDLRQYLAAKVPPPPVNGQADTWTRESARLRRRTLLQG